MDVIRVDIQPLYFGMLKRRLASNIVHLVSVQKSLVHDAANFASVHNSKLKVFLESRENTLGLLRGGRARNPLHEPPRCF
jgi:uncharacterized protein YbcV (DUF1398 family)